MGNLSHIPPSLPGESMKDYLMRLNSHPSQSNRAKSTPEQAAQKDMTHTRMGGGTILTVGNPPTDSPDDSTP